MTTLERPGPLPVSMVCAPFTDPPLLFCPCPGLWQERPPHRHSDRAERLAADLDELGTYAAGLLVTLMETDELARAGVAEIGAAAERAGLRWIHLPIVDGSAPDSRFERRWPEAGTAILHALEDGKAVAIHCLGGLGRSGVVVARLLVECGMAPSEAVTAVRAQRADAIETVEQERYVRGLRRTLPPTRRERFVGCLLAGAVGDALGAPTEFLDLDRIRAKYGPEGLRDLAPAYGHAVAITDDTQMTLFTAAGLLEALTTWSKPGSARDSARRPDYVASVFQAYLRWLETQTDPHLESTTLGPLSVDHPGLLERRGPGSTCLTALRGGIPGDRARPINGSKGCGGIMRAAPAGLLPHSQKLHDLGLAFEEADDAAFDLGLATAALTHGHPSGYYSAAALALLVSRLVAGDALDDAVARVEERLAAEPAAAECLAALRSALRLHHSGTAPTPESVETLGEAWVGDEALAVSVYCSLAAHGDVGRGLLLAANHSGDSDSTGAITGNILGALLGRRAIPLHWQERIELGETIERLALELHGRR